MGWLCARQVRCLLYSLWPYMSISKPLCPLMFSSVAASEHFFGLICLCVCVCLDTSFSVKVSPEPHPLHLAFSLSLSRPLPLTSLNSPQWMSASCMTRRPTPNMPSKCSISKSRSPLPQHPRPPRYLLCMATGLSAAPHLLCGSRRGGFSAESLLPSGTDFHSGSL